MPNHTATLYIRSKSGYRKPPKNLIDLSEGETYQLMWYEGTKKRSRNVGRFADAAEVARINQRTTLRKGKVSESAPQPTGNTKGRSLTTSLAEYLKEVRVGKSKKTYQAYSVTLNAFTKICTATTLEKMTREHVLDFTLAMREDGLTPRTIANRLSFLRTFFLHFELAWPMKKTDRVKFTEKVVEAYSAEQLQQLFAVADQEETDLFQFFLCTGVREQEAMFATWLDVDFHGKTFKVSEKLDLGFTPKDKEEASVPIPDDLVDLLKARRKRNPNTRLIFPLDGDKPNGHMLRTLQRLAQRAGLGHYKWGLHRFRKTFATMHHESGISARTIQRWLRHSSLDTTLRYLAGSDDKSKQTRMKVNNTFSSLNKREEAA